MKTPAHIANEIFYLRGKLWFNGLITGKKILEGEEKRKAASIKLASSFGLLRAARKRRSICINLSKSTHT